MRGHEDESQTAPAIDWASLAKLKGTIVCYAGTKQLPAILDALISHGMSKTESAAVIYEGTLPGQQTVEGTLGELAELTALSRPRRPAILVVGRVVALRQHLRWFDERPLFGRRVVVTRPREDAADLVDRLASLGAETVEAPMIRITEPEDWAPLDRAVDDVSTYAWIVFTSVNAVDHFMERLYRGNRDVRELKGVRLCAVGPSTRDRLSRYGVRIDLVPTDFRARRRRRRACPDHAAQGHPIPAAPRRFRTRTAGGGPAQRRRRGHGRDGVPHAACRTGPGSRSGRLSDAARS